MAKRDVGQMYQLAKLASVGIEIGASVAVGIGFGYWLQTKIGYEPWPLVIGLAYGVAAAGRALYRMVKKIQKLSPPPDHDPET